MADLVVLADDKFAVSRLSELVVADHRFGYDHTYQVVCKAVSQAEADELLAKSERFVSVFSPSYVAQAGVDRVRALTFVESCHHVYCLVPAVFAAQSFIFKTNDQPLQNRAGLIIWAVRQLHVGRDIPAESFYDRHRGLY